MNYLKQAAEFVRQGVADFQMPQLTDWVVTGTGGTTFSVDVGDLATGGAAYVVPLNFNVSAGTTEVALRHRSANLSVTFDGVGGGASAGLGWSVLPVGGSYAGGALFGGGPGMDMPSGGIGCLVAGPKANSIVIAPKDLEGVLTIGTSEANFGPNGVTLAVAIFADRPVLNTLDLFHIKAFVLVWGVQFVAGSVAIGAGGMVFRCTIRESSLPFPGARYGASVART